MAKRTYKRASNGQFAPTGTSSQKDGILRQTIAALIRNKANASTIASAKAELAGLHSKAKVKTRKKRKTKKKKAKR
jgi:hypothetical protein